MLVEALELDVS